jgi:hypothetical protein
MTTTNYRWDIFISHASEDKDAVVSPLSVMLTRRGLLVWIDNQELLLGDSLRRKIDEGLANSRYGAVVLSRSFFRKEWPQKELDALISRERGGARVVIPIWHQVTFADVAAYSPMLADRLAADTSDGLERIASEIARVIQRDRSTVVDAEAARALSRMELAAFTADSVDPTPWGPVRREGMNAHLSDAALRALIVSRNTQRKPTYLLRQEYDRRLRERGS